MARSFSSTIVQALYSQTTGEAFLVSLALSHSSFPTVRIVNNTVDITRNSNVYTARPFSIILAAENEQSPKMRVVFDNVTRELISEVRSIPGSERIAVAVEVFAASAPDTTLMAYADFTLTNVVYDAMQLSGELIVEDYIQEAFPAQTFSPSTFPGVF